MRAVEAAKTMGGKRRRPQQQEQELELEQEQEQELEQVERTAETAEAPPPREPDQPRKKKRKRPKKTAAGASVPLQGWRPLTSQKEARKVTSKFHDLTRQLEQLDEGPANAQTKAERAKVQAQLDNLGGRKRYQEASMLLTSLNKSSSKWVFQNITRLGMRPARGEPLLRVLEVGAINTQLLSCPWLDVMAIDLKSRNPAIKELDFFDVSVKEPARFDVICNAMVVNCVPTETARGDMLVRCARLLKADGLFCLVLPLRCVGAPSKSAMSRMLECLGLSVVHTSESPKIAFFAARKTRPCWHLSSDDGACPSTRLNAIKLRAQDASFTVRFSPQTLSDLCCCEKD